MVKQALEHGPMDALVHLVGGFAGGSGVAETSDETWDGMMNLNLRTAFCCMRAALKPMTAAECGRIVAVGSRMAVEPIAELRGLLGIEGGAGGADEECRGRGQGVGDHGECRFCLARSTRRRTARPCRRRIFRSWVKPESIAKMLVFLVSNAAGDISGAVIPIYGRA